MTLGKKNTDHNAPTTNLSGSLYEINRKRVIVCNDDDSRNRIDDEGNIMNETPVLTTFIPNKNGAYDQHSAVTLTTTPNNISMQHAKQHYHYYYHQHNHIPKHNKNTKTICSHHHDKMKMNYVNVNDKNIKLTTL